MSGTINEFIIPGMDISFAESGFIELKSCSDGYFQAGEQGVLHIFGTKDQKLELICFADRTIAYVKSSLGYPAYYPVQEIKKEQEIKAVLMDLDGTTVWSEEFWIWIIEKSVGSLLNDPTFTLEEEDLPYVSGHSVSEHLTHCVEKHTPSSSIEEARNYYFKHTKEEMGKIMEGKGRKGAFTPTEGVGAFLQELKKRNIKVGLVTSGLYEKAYPEILSAFQTLEMGKPEEFFDSIITAGYPLKKGSTGTLGELEAKPHPWLYAESGVVGLGIPFEERGHVIGIEDSGAGVCAVRLAGYQTIGIAGGNILSSGTRGMCNHYCNNFNEILKIIDGKEV